MNVPCTSLSSELLLRNPDFQYSLIYSFSLFTCSLWCCSFLYLLLSSRCNTAAVFTESSYFWASWLQNLHEMRHSSVAILKRKRWTYSLLLLLLLSRHLEHGVMRDTQFGYTFSISVCVHVTKVTDIPLSFGIACWCAQHSSNSKGSTNSITFYCTGTVHMTRTSKNYVPFIVHERYRYRPVPRRDKCLSLKRTITRALRT